MTTKSTPPAGKVADTILTDEEIAAIHDKWARSSNNRVELCRAVESEVRAALARSQPLQIPLQRYFNSEFGVEKFSNVQHKNMPYVPTYYLAADVDALIASRSQPQGEPVAVDRRRCKPCGATRGGDSCWKCGAETFTPDPRCGDDPKLPPIDRIRELAKEVGYAIGVHGSQQRDFDIIAAPWTDMAIGNHALLQHIAAGLITDNGPAKIISTERKPLGRYAATIQMDGWYKQLDISVCPNEQYEYATPVAQPVTPLQAPDQAQETQKLPKWIDNEKGKDPFMDDVIAYIEGLLSVGATAEESELDRIKRMAATLTAENFLMLSDDAKREFFAMAVEDSSARKLADERMAFLHTINKDAEGYEYGVCKVKHSASGQIESFLWCASDHSDVDAAIKAMAPGEKP